MQIGYGILIPVLPLFVADFGVGYGMIGLALGGMALGTVVADFPAGALLRVFDRKSVMIGGLVILGVSVIMLFWCSAVWQVILARIVGGVGTAMFNLSRHAYITEVTKPQGRGRELALFGGLARAGVFLGPAIGGLVAGLCGLKFAFLVYGFLVIMALLCSVLFVETSNIRGTRSSTMKTALLMIYRSQNRVLGAAGIGQIMVQLVRRAREAIIPLYASEVIGLDVQAVGWVVSGAALVDMLMFIPAGYIMDRFGRKYAIVPSFLLQGIGLVAIPIADSFIGLLLIGFVIGIGNGLGSGSMMTLGADLAPRQALGEFLGIWRLIGDTGSTAGPLLVGVVASAVSLPLATVLAGGVGFCAAAIFAAYVPETLPPRQPKQQAD